MSRLPLAVCLPFLLSGCAPSISGSVYTDGRFTYSNVKSASDIAGGPRQDIVVITDRDGVIIETAISNGVGTLQAIAAGLGGAVIAAGGQAAGSALIRPARNQTNVRMDVQGTGGSGGSNTTTATSSSAGSTATGGAGGTATGGTATSSFP